MNITDTEKLRSTYEFLQESSSQKVDNSTLSSRKTIPTIKIESGVTLEEIKDRQTLIPITYNEIVEMVEEEEWDQSLEVLLESID